MRESTDQAIAMSAGARLRRWAQRRAVQVGIVPGPRDREPAFEVAHTSGPSWLWMCIGAWAVMFGPVIAGAPWMPEFCLAMGLLLVAALPVAYHLHYSRVSRWLVNWIVFYAAVILGAVAIIRTWPPGGVHSYYGLEASFGALVRAFLWVMAFRAFAIRTPKDLVLSIIPALSATILVLLSAPSVWSVAGTTLMSGAMLYLLAAEQVLTRGQEGAQVASVRRVTWEVGPRRGATVNTWQAVALVVLAAALVASAGASHFRGSSDLGRALQVMLAQYLASLWITERADYSPETVISLSGAPPPAGDRVLFRVRCDRPGNWRQQVYAVYDGTAWRQQPTRKVRAGSRSGRWYPDTRLVSGFRPEGAVAVRQTFELRAPFSVALPGLFLAVEVQAPVVSLRMGEDGTLACSGFLRAGQSVEVTSLVPAEGPAPRTGALPPLDPALSRIYLQLPPDLPARVRQLAREVTRDARHAYDMAVLIQNHLADSYPYTLRPPPRPPGRDFVDHFLFEAKAGYCHHYASAMVVLCRCLGLPARFVTGFVPGEYLPKDDSYEVRAKDAHSWAEVYIEGRGWQSFEPTPPQEEEDKRVLSRAWQWAQAVLADLALVARGFSREGRWLAGWLSVALVSLGTALALQRRRWYGQTRLRGPRVDPRQRVLFVYSQMLRWLAHFRLPRGPSQPPLEYLGSLPAQAAGLQGELRAITGHYLRARYGARAVTASEAEAAEQALARLQRALFEERQLRARLAGPASV